MRHTQYFILNEKSIFVSLIIKYIKDCSNNGLEKYSLSRLVYFKFQDNSFKNNFYINYTFSLYETLLICPSVPYLHATSSLIWTCICSYPGNKHNVWLTFYQFTWTKGPSELLPSLGVRRLSSVNFSHFKLLLRNHLADWNRTQQEFSLDGPLQSYCFSFQSNIQYGCQGQ